MGLLVVRDVPIPVARHPVFQHLDARPCPGVSGLAECPAIPSRVERRDVPIPVDCRPYLPAQVEFARDVRCLVELILVTRFPAESRLVDRDPVEVVDLQDHPAAYRGADQRRPVVFRAEFQAGLVGSMAGPQGYQAEAKGASSVCRLDGPRPVHLLGDGPAHLRDDRQIPSRVCRRAAHAAGPQAGPSSKRHLAAGHQVAPAALTIDRPRVEASRETGAPLARHVAYRPRRDERRHRPASSRLRDARRHLHRAFSCRRGPNHKQRWQGFRMLRRPPT